MSEGEVSFLGFRYLPQPTPEVWNARYNELDRRRWQANEVGGPTYRQTLTELTDHLNNGFRPSVRFGDKAVMYLGEPTISPRMD